MLQEGDILKDRYRITQLIGRGGMSRVFMATDMRLSNKLWAVKEVSRSATDQAGRPIEQSLAIEAELLSKLDHPMIVDIADIVSTDECIYVVMDYVEGKSLDKVIREEGPQSEEDVQDWIMQICDALDYLHNQDPPIIYRDMKPSNIMLRPDGYVKLIDLGVAREYKDQSTKDTVAFGTEGYAPPEQYGKAQTDARSDIYALGATMWNMLSGESPTEYPLPDVRTKNPKVGEGFAHVIVPKCTQLDRDLRYQNCNDLMADLEVYEELTQEYYDKQKSKVKKFAMTAGAGLAMLLISLCLFLVGNVIVNNNYNAQMDIARTARNSSDSNAVEQAYEEAIKYKPGEIAPYKELWEYYETQTGNGTQDLPVFTTDEFNHVKDLIDKNYGSLMSSGTYGDLCYELGKAIWDNYDDGSNSNDILIRPTAINKSKDFFIIARDNATQEIYKKYSDMYIKIAEFTQKIQTFKDDNDGANDNTTELIKDYFDALKDLCSIADNSSSNKMKLTSYAIIQRAIYDNAKEFHSAGISKNEIEDLLKRIRNGINGLDDFRSQVYNTAKNFTLNSLNSTAAAVERAYSNTGVGNK